MTTCSGFSLDDTSTVIAWLDAQVLVITRRQGLYGLLYTSNTGAKIALAKKGAVIPRLHHGRGRRPKTCGHAIPHVGAPVAKLGSSQHRVQIGDWGDRLSAEGAYKELFLQFAKQNEMECNYLTSV